MLIFFFGRWKTKSDSRMALSVTLGARISLFYGEVEKRCGSGRGPRAIQKRIRCRAWVRWAFGSPPHGKNTLPWYYADPKCRSYSYFDAPVGFFAVTPNLVLLPHHTPAIEHFSHFFHPKEADHTDREGYQHFQRYLELSSGSEEIATG